MGLTKTSFAATDSDVTHYNGYGSTWTETAGLENFISFWATINSNGTAGTGSHTRSCVKFTTDAAGASSLSFAISDAHRGSANWVFAWNGEPWVAITTTKTPPTSGTKATLNSSSPMMSGTLTGLKLLPNTTYYLWFSHSEGDASSRAILTYYGTLTLTASGTYGQPGEISANNANFDGNVNMSFGSATTGGTYTVTVKVGSSTAETLQTKSSTTSRTWVPSLSKYASSYPSQKTVSAVITVQTYFGSVLSGTKTKTITLTFTQAQVGVTVSGAFSIAAVNTGSVAGLTGYIQGYSKIRATYKSSGVTLKYSATVTKWTVKFGSAAAVDVATSTTTKDSGVISATTSVVCKVTDSRGFTASTTLTATITPYQKPTLTASAYRCNASGTASDTGTYIAVTFSALYASVANQNTMTLQVKWKTSSASSYGTANTVTGGTTTTSGTNKTYAKSKHLFSGFSDLVYNVQVTATDKLGNVATVNITITSQAWALHIRNKGAGAAFGKVAERDSELDVGDWRVRCGAITSIIWLEIASFSSLPKTVSNSAIKAGHIVLRDEVGTPSAMTSDWTVTTAAGSLTISGSISGSTTLRLILGIPGTTG